MNIFDRVRLVLIAERTIKQIQQESAGMKLSSNVILQLLATLGHGVNEFGGLVPSKYQFWVTVALGGIQLATSVVAHYAPAPGTVEVTGK
jgi:hypothetical protein